MIEENTTIEPTEDEPKVIFRAMSDRDVMRIYSEETGQTLAEISGYNLAINFNMQLINSIQDIEAVLSGLTELFRDSIMRQMLKDKNKQSEEERTIN